MIEMKSKLKKNAQIIISLFVFFISCQNRENCDNIGIKSFQLVGTEQIFEQEGDNIFISAKIYSKEK